MVPNIHVIDSVQLYGRLNSSVKQQNSLTFVALSTAVIQILLHGFFAAKLLIVVHRN